MVKIFKKITFLFLLTLLFGNCTNAQNNGKSIKFSKQYKGVVQIGLDKKTPSPEVIRDKDSYYNFISRIPQEEISMMPNPPKSDNPLLKKPKINFKTSMLIVIYNYSISSEMKEFKIEENDGKIKITYRTESFISAQPVDVCGFYAFVIPKYPDVEFVNLNALNID